MVRGGASHGHPATQGEARNIVRGAIAAARAGRARCRPSPAARQEARALAAPGARKRDGRADRSMDHLAGAAAAGVEFSARASAALHLPSVRAALVRAQRCRLQVRCETRPRHVSTCQLVSSSTDVHAMVRLRYRNATGDYNQIAMAELQ